MDEALKDKAVRGVSWMVLTSCLTRVLGMVGTVTLTHYLKPEVVGEVAAAYLALFTANQIALPMSTLYPVAHPKAGRDVGFHVTLIHLLTGLPAIALVVFIAGPLGTIFKAPQLIHLAPLLAISVALDRVRGVPERLLMRDLKFSRIALSKTVGELTYSITSVSLAAAGLGAMAVVGADIARSLLCVLLIMASASWADWLTPVPFCKETARKILSFSWPLSLASLTNFGSRAWDSLMVASFYGPEVVGRYNLAHNLAEIPTLQVGEQVAEVLLPSFARLPNDEERRKALLGSLAVLSLVVFPMLAGIAVVAPTLMHAFMAKAWQGMAPMLAIQASVSVCRPWAVTLNAYLQAESRNHAMMWLGFLRVALLMAFVGTVGRISPLWACVGVGIEFGGHVLIAGWLIGRRDKISFASFWKSAQPSLLACVPLVLAVLGARWAVGGLELSAQGVGFWKGLAPRVAGLSVELVAGVLGYLAGVAVFARPEAKSVLSTIKEMRAKRQRQAGPAVAEPSQA